MLQPHVQALLSGALSLGVPLVLAVRELILLSRADAATPRPDSAPEPSPLPLAPDDDARLPPLPACLLDAVRDRPLPAVRVLEDA